MGNLAEPVLIKGNVMKKKTLELSIQNIINEKSGWNFPRLLDYVITDDFKSVKYQLVKLLDRFDELAETDRDQKDLELLATILYKFK